MKTKGPRKRAFFIWVFGILGVQREKSSNASPTPTSSLLKHSGNGSFRPVTDVQAKRKTVVYPYYSQ